MSRALTNPVSCILENNMGLFIINPDPMFPLLCPWGGNICLEYLTVAIMALVSRVTVAILSAGILLEHLTVLIDISSFKDKGHSQLRDHIDKPGKTRWANQMSPAHVIVVTPAGTHVLELEILVSAFWVIKGRGKHNTWRTPTIAVGSDCRLGASVSRKKLTVP